MPLSSGTKLGPYEIVAPLGAGGMGEVYRGRDTRLGREVAVKILSSSLASNPELRQRFEREARAVSSLQHPHICVLHDVGRDRPRGASGATQEELDFLVMEYLEGETLAERLGKGALSLEQVLKTGMEIADALHKAHRQGLVHRDLKPSNVMLTKTGAKLMDFGLAKPLALGAVAAALGSRPNAPTVVAADAGQLPSFTAAPTVTGPSPAASPLTSAGTIVGTIQYMSPEQIEGKEADARSDIFALGAVLYEMATRKKAFAGKSQLSVATAILEKDVEAVSALRPAAPPALDHVIRACLEKDPEARWQSAADIKRELQWIAEAGEHAIPAASGLRWRRAALWASTLAALLLALLAGWLVFRPAPAAELRVLRFDVTVPATSDPVSFALSPDGRKLVYAATTDGVTRLWLRPLDQAMAQPLPGTQNPSYPFWSPNSRSIGFFAEGKLKRLDLASGAPQVLTDAAAGRGGTWNGDDIILFAPFTLSALYRIPAGGGAPFQVSHPNSVALSHRFPQFLPDGLHYIFYAGFGSEEALYLGSLEGAPPKRLLANDSAAVYADPGYLVLVQQGVLVARPLDVTRGIVGDSIPIVQPVGIDIAIRKGAFSVSAAGVLAHRAMTGGQRQVVWFDRRGRRLGAVAAPDEAVLQNVALSPDGRRVAVNRYIAGNYDIWLLEVGRGVATRFTFDSAIDTNPIWSPDGRVVFRSNRNGPFDLYEKPANGAASEQLLLKSGLQKIAADWSRDGKFLLYRELDPKTGWDLWALPLAGDRKPFPVVQTPFNDRNGQFSPDGKWVAYDSNESGRSEIYLVPFGRPGGKWQVSAAGGVAPRWRHDGRELFYIAPDGAMMAVPITFSADGKSLEPGTPSHLFRVPIVYGGSPVDYNNQQYDVARDGRFLVNVTTEEAKVAPISVLVNWMAALKKQ